MSNQDPLPEPNFSTLVISIASMAALNLGLAPNPETQQTQVDLRLAQFHIDLLSLLKTKTNSNLTPEESQFLNHVVTDLQLKFVAIKERK